MAAIVCKFGGTSVADAGQVRKIESILRADARRRYAVVSALGKRKKEDQKVTDLLYLCHELAAAGLDISEPFHIIRDRHLELAGDLGVNLDVAGLLEEVRKQTQGGASRDFVASRGEYLSGRIVAAYLRARFVDPADGILFTPDGQLDDRTYDRLDGLLKGDGLFVIPGFYGANPDGSIHTFPRGGSDISGAVVARAVRAEAYENWTDVSGFLMTDPRIVPDAMPIREVTYRELRELAYMGATVLQDEAIFPVRQLRIPIHIRNTNAPDDPGTLVLPSRGVSDTGVTGIAGKRGFSMVFIEKALMNKEHGFGRKVLEILESHGISYEHSPTGIDSMSVVIEDEEIAGKEEIIRQEIQRILEPDRVDITSGLALIATVGEGMAYRVGVAARVFTALAQAGVNVRIIDQGSSEINIIVGVDQKDYETAVKALYKAFA
ncbi:MAG: aspartate kinase [Candidatus Latescibacteria bacterium]|nr:aspartate kinase [Candidatus Latescibacterota bacterium]